MSRQQINLYQPIFRKARKLLSFRVLLQATAAVCVLLLLLYVYTTQQTRQMQADLAQLQAQLERRLAQVSEFSARLAQRTVDSSAEQAVARLRNELAARRQVVEALSRVRESYTRGLSPYLTAFARQIPDEVWLNGFSIARGGEDLVLRGHAHQPALVAEFLRRLSAEQSLHGTHFGLLQIQRGEPRAAQVDFTLYTGDEPPTEAAP